MNTSKYSIPLVNFNINYLHKMLHFLIPYEMLDISQGVIRLDDTCIHPTSALETPLDVAKESSFSIYEECSIQPDVLTPKDENFYLFPPVLQFLTLEENRSNFTLRSLAKQTIYDCMVPYENEKVDQLPLPSRLKCYVGGITYTQWMKQRENPALHTRVGKCNIL